MFDENWFDAPENFGSLNGMGAGADFKIDVWGGDAHLAKKNVGKRGVVVLAGVNENGLDLRMALHLAHERRDFGEIGTGPYYVDDFQAVAHELVESVRGGSIAFGLRRFGALE